MSEMLTVPATIVVQLRGGLIDELGFAASDVSAASARSDRHLHLYPQRLTAPIERFERHRALLEEIGWTASNQPMPLNIDLTVHRPALLEALESLLTAERDLANLPPHIARAGDQQPTAQRHTRELEQFLATIHRQTERAEHPIVLLLLDDEHPETWTRAQLNAQLKHIPAPEIDAALTHLQAEDALTIDGEQIAASRCAQHLDRLEPIAI